MQKFTRRHFLIATTAASFVPAHAKAAAYPAHPIRVVIPFTAGGVPDNLMRLLAVSMEARLGQKFVIEAKPGGAGNIGTQEVVHSEPDGYTLLVAATHNFAINQFLMKLRYDPLTALVPIAKLAEIPLVLFSNPKVPARNLKELVEYARAHPGRLSYGIPTLGTVNHLLMERLKQAAGVEIGRVPYRGSPEAVLALIKNDIQVFPVGLAAVAGHLKEGTLTALAVGTEQRIPMLPDVPTFAESGFPDLAAANWFGLAAPAGTPNAVLDALAAAVAEAHRTEAVRARFGALGMLVPELSRRAFAESMKAEAALWHETVQRGRITLE